MNDQYFYLTFPDEMAFWTALMESVTGLLVAEFSLVFAYIAGLFFFIRRTRRPLRWFVHCGVLMLMGYFWFMFYVHYSMGDAFLEHRALAVERGTTFLSDSFVAKHTSILIAFAMWLIHLAQALAVFGLTYLAFWFDWSKPEGGK